MNSLKAIEFFPCSFIQKAIDHLTFHILDAMIQKILKRKE